MKMRMPTRLRNGEGRASGEAIDMMHPSRFAGVVGTARWKGDAGNRGRPVRSEVAPSTLLVAADRAGVGQGRTTVEAG